jgi:hypothetical protein
MRWRRVPLIDEYDISEKFPTFISPEFMYGEIHALNVASQHVLSENGVLMRATNIEKGSRRPR